VRIAGENFVDSPPTHLDSNPEPKTCVDGVEKFAEDTVSITAQ